VDVTPAPPGWLTVDEIAQQLFAEAMDEVQTEAFGAAIHGNPFSDRALAMALVSVIFLCQDSASEPVRRYFTGLLDRLGPLQDVFDDDQKCRIAELPDAAILRWRRPDGQVELLVRQDFWGPMAEQLLADRLGSDREHEDASPGAL